MIRSQGSHKSLTRNPNCSSRGIPNADHGQHVGSAITPPVDVHDEKTCHPKNCEQTPIFPGILEGVGTLCLAVDLKGNLLLACW